MATVADEEAAVGVLMEAVTAVVVSAEEALERVKEMAQMVRAPTVTEVAAVEVLMGAVAVATAA